MDRGIHWEKVGKFVAYSSFGLNRVVQEFKSRKLAENGSDPLEDLEMPWLMRETQIDVSAATEQPKAEEVWTAKVLRTFPRNPRFMFAELLRQGDGGDEQNPAIASKHMQGKKVRVRVPNNKHFVKGMEMSVRPLHGDLFEISGRVPRFRGKW